MKINICVQIDKFDENLELIGIDGRFIEINRTRNNKLINFNTTSATKQHEQQQQNDVIHKFK